MKYGLIFVLLLILVEQLYSQERGDSLGHYTICGNITGFKPGCTLKMALYSSQENFDKKKFTKAIRILKDKVVGDTIKYCFHGIKDGKYMIAIFQDLNDNGEINKNFIGIPTEPYLIYKSNGGLAIPKFEKSKFRVNSDITDANLRFKIR